MTSPRRFRPRLIPTLLVLVGVGMLLSLGTWQWLRYRDTLAEEALRAERVDLPPARLEHLDQLAGGELDYRVVQVQGTLDTSRLQVFKHRTRDTRPGYWVGAPLILDGGGALLANMGWVPIQEDPTTLRAPAGPPQLWEGLLYTSDHNIADEPTRARLAGAQPDEAVFWDSFDVTGIYALLDEPTPASPSVLVLSEAHSGQPFPAADYDHIVEPYLTSERHLGYSMTWYLMAVGLVGLWIAASMGLLQGGAPRGRLR